MTTRSRLRCLTAAASFCACLVHPGDVRAQGGFTTAAEAVARQVITHMDAMRWNEAAALFHPAAREMFKRTQVRQAQMMEMARQQARRSYRDPQMPAEVSAWMDRQDSIARARTPSIVSMQFLGITGAAQLDSLSSVEVVARWLQARDERARTIDRAMRGSAPQVSRPPGAVEPPQQVRTVVGGVWEDDSTAQVLVRTRMQRSVLPDPGRFSVMTLRRSPQGWRVWTVDGSDAWIGAPSFSFSNDMPAELARQLDARRDSTLTWRDAAGNSVRAAVLGYPGAGRPPRSALVEVRAPDGSLHAVEIPYGALADVLRYFSPWIVLPALAEGRTPY